VKYHESENAKKEHKYYPTLQQPKRIFFEKAKPA